MENYAKKQGVQARDQEEKESGEESSDGPVLDVDEDDVWKDISELIRKEYNQEKKANQQTKDASQTGLADIKRQHGSMSKPNINDSILRPNKERSKPRDSSTRQRESNKDVKPAVKRPQFKFNTKERPISKLVGSDDSQSWDEHPIAHDSPKRIKRQKTNLKQAKRKLRQINDKQSQDDRANKDGLKSNQN